jgi:hypothetical protein
VPSDDRDRAARLLLKAIEPLSKRDRELVLRMLVTGRIGLGGVGRRRFETAAPPMVPSGHVGPALSRQVDQPLLVRLPARLHDRLRRWATANGFSMAGVVRGLVERFLDEQDATGRGR